MNTLARVIAFGSLAVLPWTPVLAKEPPAEPVDEARLDEAWQKLSARDKTQVLQFHRAFRQMEPEERDFIRERIEKLGNLTPPERTQLRANRQRWQQMSPEEKERARQEYRRRREELEKRWREKQFGQEPPPPPAARRSPEPPPQPTQP